MADLLAAVGVPCTLVEIVSAGDVDKTTPLYEMDTRGTPGFFTKELEAELLAGRIDLAVHSLKDLPTDQPPGLVVAAIPRREETPDCLIISPEAVAADRPWKLRKGSRVGTSSLRREAELLCEMPDLEVVPLRGNVPGRIEKVREGKLDAAVLARAGLNRLKLDLSDLVVFELPSDTFIPAPGQGALAIECSAKLASSLAEKFARLNDPRAEKETRIERAVLKGLHGGCSLPLGVKCLAEPGSKELKLKAFLGLLQPAGEGTPKRWISFHRFDISHAEEETLVDKTILKFKEVMHANPGGK